MFGSHFLFNGAILGFSIAAPVGPIGVLCIRRSLADGAATGLAVGLGAATADAAYGCVAAFGLTTVSGFLVGQKFLLGLIGGIFLCYLGVRTFISRPPEHAAETRGGSLSSAYVATLFLTITNPMTILSFAAIFAGLGLGLGRSFAGAASLVLGVFLGSALWWLLLSTGVGLLRSRFRTHWMRMVNRVSGVMIFGFGLLALAAAWRR